MAGKNWQAGSKDMFLAQVVVCLAALAAGCGPARADVDVPASYLASNYLTSLGPNVLWEMLIGGIVGCAFFASLAIWIHSALRRTRRKQVRRSAYISSALNSLNQGVVMTDPKNRIVYCNDRYLEIYSLERSDLLPGMTGAELAVLRSSRGTLNCGAEEFFELAGRPEGLVTELSNGRSITTRYFPLPNGGSIATHEDSTEQRKLSRQLASTKQFLESVLDNPPNRVAPTS